MLPLNRSRIETQKPHVRAANVPHQNTLGVQYNWGYTSSMARLRLVAVKLTAKQLATLDAEARRRRTKTSEVAASRSSVLRDALVRLVEGVHA